jgi:hypothetical protein
VGFSEGIGKGRRVGSVEERAVSSAAANSSSIFKTCVENKLLRWTSCARSVTDRAVTDLCIRRPVGEFQRPIKINDGLEASSEGLNFSGQRRRVGEGALGAELSFVQALQLRQLESPLRVSSPSATLNTEVQEVHQLNSVVTALSELLTFPSPPKTAPTTLLNALSGVVDIALLQFLLLFFFFSFLFGIGGPIRLNGPRCCLFSPALKHSLPNSRNHRDCPESKLSGLHLQEVLRSFGSTSEEKSKGEGW